MRKATSGLLTCLAILIATSASADWKARSMWCAAEVANTKGGDIAQNLQDHSAAHERYCKACAGKIGQFEALLVCYQGKEEKSVAARKELVEAGREKVNTFMESKAPACCKPKQ